MTCRRLWDLELVVSDVNTAQHLGSFVKCNNSLVRFSLSPSLPNALCPITRPPEFGHHCCQVTIVFVINVTPDWKRSGVVRQLMCCPRYGHTYTEIACRVSWFVSRKEVKSCNLDSVPEAPWVGIQGSLQSPLQSSQAFLILLPSLHQIVRPVHSLFHLALNIRPGHLSSWGFVYTITIS